MVSFFFFRLGMAGSVNFILSGSVELSLSFSVPLTLTSVRTTGANPIVIPIGPDNLALTEISDAMDENAPDCSLGEREENEPDTSDLALGDENLSTEEENAENVSAENEYAGNVSVEADSANLAAWDSLSDILTFLARPRSSDVPLPGHLGWSSPSWTSSSSLASLSPRRQSSPSSPDLPNTAMSSIDSVLSCPSNWSNTSRGVNFLIPAGGVVESVTRVDGEIVIGVSLPFDQEDEIIFLGEVRRA